MKEFEKCLDCEAKSHWAKLQGLDTYSNPQESLCILKDVLIWILENTDYPVGEE
jgi:hypothetical protein